MHPLLCDECNETLDTGTSGFDAARNPLKRERWVTGKDGDVRESGL
jgi:hypothetical protein